MVAVSRGPRQMEGKLGDASGSGGAKKQLAGGLGGAIEQRVKRMWFWAVL